MTSFIVAYVLGGNLLAAMPPDTASTRFEFSRTEMAVPIELVLYAPEIAAATRGAEAVFARLHELNGRLSDYDPQSELSRLSSSSGEGKAVPVSDDLWKILVAAQDMSRRSDGAFDVTVGPVIRLWRRARRHHELPPPAQIQDALAAVGYQAVRLVPERQAVELLKPHMRLDLGGIAKGYAMAEALKVLRGQGLSRAMIHGGGDLAVGDPPPGQPGWKIGIAPLELNGPPSQYIIVSHSAVSTSGDTWQYVEIDGRRYSHVVDPRTGMALTDHNSVTVVHPDSTLADALSKAVAVLGHEKGLKLVDEIPGAAAWLIRAPQGKLETYPSSRWKDLPKVATEGRK